MVECGRACSHDEYGQVIVLGIWKGVVSINSVRALPGDETIIVSYLTEGQNQPLLADTLDDFLEAIDVTS